MKFIKPFVVFLIFNFGALGIGNWLMGNGAQSDWYLKLNKAPWTPEGWVFGVAWLTVMFCFSIYMAQLWRRRPTFKVIILFVAQFILNISWNHFFFGLHWIDTALTIIVGLTIIISAFLLTYRKDLQLQSLFILPYLIWLFLATSLNLYASIYN